MDLQSFSESRASEVPQRRRQLVHQVGRAMYETAPASLSTDRWHVQQIVLPSRPGMTVVIPVIADLTGNALGLA